ncbi:IS30 family transposase [Shouchella lonarensis]|uniref:Transposase, IS30 family n=1 Tax=Shouchella lonarensis TaxID=1464122 RepID=A0A1G6IY61_9BACI|nr:IS30 family transposase [Shouchella lonarensis]SDC11399.1 transposase, IS30 family [Shouchella lonarensis]
MSYQHLTTFERARIETFYSQGQSIRAIAKKLNRSPSTISRELKRNSEEKFYQPESAQENYHKRRLRCGRIGKWSCELAEIINEKLKQTWSPEQIVGRLFQGTISFKTIYRWIYQGLLVNQDLSFLRHKGKRQKPLEKRGRFNIGTSISQRPKEIRKRETFGHWELDSVVSSRGKSKACLATFVERKTRWYIAFKISDRTSSSMEKAIRTLNEQLPAGAFQTATVDRGKEFACYSSIEQDTDIQLYFADPYSSWQRGSNENANGLLREFFPKKTDFATVSGEELEFALSLINHRPRKCLKWKTTHEVFQEEVLHLI